MRLFQNHAEKLGIAKACLHLGEPARCSWTLFVTQGKPPPKWSTRLLPRFFFSVCRGNRSHHVPSTRKISRKIPIFDKDFVTDNEKMFFLRCEKITLKICLENWRRFDKATIQQLFDKRPNDSAMAMRHVYDDMLSRHLVGGIPTPMVVNGG